MNIVFKDADHIGRSKFPALDGGSAWFEAYQDMGVLVQDFEGIRVGGGYGLLIHRFILLAERGDCHLLAAPDFLCAAPCRRSMPLRRRAGRAASREKYSLLDFDTFYTVSFDKVCQDLELHRNALLAFGLVEQKPGRSSPDLIFQDIEGS